MGATIMGHTEKEGILTSQVMDSELAVVTQKQDTGIAKTTFVKTSGQLSVVVKISTEC